jgi:hypothetical protein
MHATKKKRKEKDPAGDVRLTDLTCTVLIWTPPHN